RYRPGTIVFHASGWGVGEVKSFDPHLRQAVVDLDKKRQHRMDLRAMPDVLEALPPDHFMALARRGDELKALAAADPVRLVEVVVMSFGNPLDLKAIKARLVPEVIPADGWSKWWSRAKALLRESGYWRVSDRSP